MTPNKKNLKINEEEEIKVWTEKALVAYDDAVTTLAKTPRTQESIRYLGEKLKELILSEITDYLTPTQKDFYRDGFAVLLEEQTQKNLRNKTLCRINILTRCSDGTIRYNGKIITMEEANVIMINHDTK